MLYNKSNLGIYCYSNIKELKLKHLNDLKDATSLHYNLVLFTENKLKNTFKIIHYIKA